MQLQSCKYIHFTYTVAGTTPNYLKWIRVKSWTAFFLMSHNWDLHACMAEFPMKSVRLQVEGVLYDHAGLKSLKQTDNTDDAQVSMIRSYRKNKAFHRGWQEIGFKRERVYMNIQLKVRHPVHIYSTEEMVALFFFCKTTDNVVKMRSLYVATAHMFQFSFLFLSCYNAVLRFRHKTLG